MREGGTPDSVVLHVGRSSLFAREPICHETSATKGKHCAKVSTLLSKIPQYLLYLAPHEKTMEENYLPKIVQNSMGIRTSTIHIPVTDA